MTKDPMLRLVYLEALFALYEAGGSLPADPDDLSLEFLLPAKEITRCLRVLNELARAGTGRGGLLIQDGQISNGRVISDLKKAEQFRAEQAEFARQRWQKATLNNDEATQRLASGYPEATLCQPLPLPKPSNGTTPPIPPAPAGGDPANVSRPGASRPGRDRAADRRAVEEIVNAGVAHVVANGGRAWRGIRRKLREWVLAGCSFDEVKSRIDAGEHLPRSPL